MPLNISLVDFRNPVHASDLVFLLNAYARDPMGGDEELSDYCKENLADELAKNKNAFSVICYVEDKPAGLVNCFWGFSTFKCKPIAYIHDVVVLSEYRGLQISQKMLDHVEEHAKEHDCCKMTLEVLEGNEVAKNAYKKFGFKGYELDPKMGQAMFWEKAL